MTEKTSGEKLLYCSFCGKSQHEVRKLIAVVRVHLRECIELGNDIIASESAAEKGGNRDVRPPSLTKLRHPASYVIAGAGEEDHVGSPCTNTTSG